MDAKILLVQPNNFDPIALKIIGSYLLANNVEVKIINYSSNNDLIKKLTNYNPQFIGISIWTGSMILTYLKIIKVIKERFSDIKIIVGGPHASLLPKQIIQESDCDFVVCGDGETATLKIINNELENEKGILFRKEKKIFGDINLREDSLDLVETIFYNYSPLFYKKKWSNKVVRTFTTKGCPYRCGFCYRSCIGQKIKYKDINLIIKELFFLKEKYGVSNVNFFDDNFAINKNRVYKICKVLKELNIKFQFNIRVDQLDEEFVKNMAESGCAVLYLGLESGSERILKFINKNINLSTIRKKIGLLKKYHINYQASFIINLPTETKKDLDATKKLAQEIGGSSVSTFSLYAPYPKTQLFNYIKKYYPNIDLPSSLIDWADINWFNYISQINDLSLIDVRNFCKYFGVKAYQENELHKVSI